MTSQGATKEKKNTGKGQKVGPAQLLEIYQQAAANLKDTGVHVQVANDPSNAQRVVLAISGVRYCGKCKALRLIEESTPTGCQHCEVMDD